MIFRDAKAKARDGMAKRFEVEPGGRVVFRARATAVPVVVTGYERDEEIARFVRTVGRLSWTFLAAIFGGCALLVALNRPMSENSFDIWVLVIVTITAFLALYWSAWKHPDRRFAGRAIAGPALGRSEARVKALRQTSWKEMLIGAVSIIAILASEASKHDVLHGWGRLWIVGGAIALAVLGWRLIQKGRLGREG